MLGNDLVQQLDQFPLEFFAARLVHGIFVGTEMWWLSTKRKMAEMQSQRMIELTARLKKACASLGKTILSKTIL